MTVVDGRYAASAEPLRVDLRVDTAVCGAISADLFRGALFLGTVRTPPGVTVKLEDGAWDVVGADEHGVRTTGRLLLAAPAPGRIAGALTLDASLNGLPRQEPIAFTGVLGSAALRQVTLEIEREDAVAPIAPFEGHTLESCLGGAGIAAQLAPEGAPIPVPAAPWDDAMLNTLMADHAQTPLDARGWRFHLLLLSRSSKPGLLGVMFDDRGALQRQGAAVFATSARELDPEHADRLVVQTAVHETGHGFNLVHRFRSEVGYANSSSFMNYDWRYEGGDHIEDYWKAFAFTFDPDELQFLRHGPFGGVIPGGDPFQSHPYWLDGVRSWGPTVADQVPDWTLSLAGPPEVTVAGTVVLPFAAPVFLTVNLTNHGEAFPVPSALLDPKDDLEVQIAPVRTAVTSAQDDDGERFRPLVQRCYSRAADASKPLLAQGASIQENVNLSFGAGGFPFAEPGFYELTAQITTPGDVQFVVRSEPLRLRIGYPHSDADERRATTMLDPDVGRFLALGGSAVLPAARDALEDLMARGDAPPAVARALALHHARSYVRRRRGRYVTEAGDPEAARRCLDALRGAPLDAAFDPVTAEQTRALVTATR